MKMIRSLTVVMTVALMSIPAFWLLAEEPAVNENYTGTAMVLQQAAGTPSIQFTMNVKKHNTDEEVMKLAAILKEQGPAAMYQAMSKMDEAGRISIGSRVGERLSLVRVFPNDKGTLVRCVSDRPITAAELWAGGRLPDYSFSVIEIQLDEKGRGQGAFMVAAKISFNSENKLTIENYGTVPVKLMNVKKW